jgi:serine/threonine-protein kinase
MPEQLRAALADRYRIERELGTGATADVHLAWDLKHGRPVAIKVLKAEVAQSLGADRFLKEIEIAARLQHPHILPVYDSGVAGGLLYYVTPYAEGEALSGRLDREGAMPVAEAIRIGRGVASALDYAHRQGVVHRDIKPGNILLIDGHPVVADFGIARALSEAVADRITESGLAVGTPAYMSPEQATGSDRVDARSDVYSLGCVLYEMLTGEPPFTGKTPQAILARSVTTPAPPLGTRRRDASIALERVVGRALAMEPDARYEDAAAFDKALAAASAGRWVPPRFGRRARAIAAAAALLVAVAAWWLVPRAAAGSVASGADVIAVIPFTTSGAGLELLGEGMVDLLSRNLDGVGGIRAIEPRAVLLKWHGQEDGGLDAARATARAVGAGSVLMGSVVSAGPAVRLSASLHGVGGKLLAEAQVDGPADSVLTLVDSLSIHLLRNIWRSREPVPTVRLSAITSGSVQAIRAFLDGEQHYRQSRWDSAIGSYLQAVEADSTFALAYLRLSIAYGWKGGHGAPEVLEYARAASRHVDRVPQRARSLVAGNQLFGEGRMEAVDTLSAYVEGNPTDADGWYLLADAQFHAQPVLSAAPQQIFAPFDEAIKLDTTLAAAFIHPLEVALASDDRAAFDRYRPMLAAAAPGDLWRFDRSAEAVWGPPDSVAPAIAALYHGGAYPLLMGATAAFASPERDPDDVLDALARMSEGDAPGSPEYLGFRARFYTGAGRLAEARELLDSLNMKSPEAGVVLRLAPVLTGFADAASERSARNVLDRAPDTYVAAYYLRVLLAIADGETDGARRAISMVLRDTTLAKSEVVRALYGAALGWAEIVDGDSLSGIARMRKSLKSLPLTAGRQLPALLSFQYALALVARAETRADGIQRLQHGFGTDPELYGPVSLALGRALETEGDTEGAMAAYRNVVRLWSGADAGLRPFVAESEAALNRLAREPVV